jgi:hypothetical protein
LVGLRAAQTQHRPFALEADVADVEPDELAAPQRPGEPNEQQRPIAHVDAAVAAVARADRSSPTSSAVLGRGATPRSRQIPARVARTTPCAVGDSCPAARCITVIAASLRRSVGPFCSARSPRASPYLQAVAGVGRTPVWCREGPLLSYALGSQTEDLVNLVRERLQPARGTVG